MKTPNPAEGALVVLTTFPDEKIAQSIAGRLVEEKLAACVSIVPGVQSIYFWEDAVQQDREWLALMKTNTQSYARLENRLLEWHPYDTPELIAIEITRGSPAYLQWLCQSLA